MRDTIILDRLEAECIIGIFDWERTTRQKVEISLEMECDMAAAAGADDIEYAVNYKTIAKSIISLVEASEFYLIETMAEKIAALCLATGGVTQATVTVSKPGAIRNSRNVSARIVRPSLETTVFLGVGGNIDPEINIPRGIELIRSRFRLVDLSPAYESEAWGVKDPQPDYINLVAEVKTGKDIFGVRAEACWMEKIVGRKRTDDKYAPRPMDIDLLLYGDLTGEHAGGLLPHPQLLTQQFVYLPMMDLAEDRIVPGAGKPLKDLEPSFDKPDLRIERTGRRFDTSGA